MKKPVLALLFAGLIAVTPLYAQTTPTIEMFKNPSCGCCGKWAEHMKKAGFKVVTHEVDNVATQRKALGMPEHFGSCHTAKVRGYLLEGHVPAADIKKLLREKPKALGLAVPGMPAGSPGMDIPNSPPFTTLLVQDDGKSRVYAVH